jgi:hypothetical protein
VNIEHHVHPAGSVQPGSYSSNRGKPTPSVAASSGRLKSSPWLESRHSKGVTARNSPPVARSNKSSPIASRTRNHLKNSVERLIFLYLIILAEKVLLISRSPSDRPRWSHRDRRRRGARCIGHGRQMHHNQKCQRLSPLWYPLTCLVPQRNR